MLDRIEGFEKKRRLAVDNLEFRIGFGRKDSVERQVVFWKFSRNGM